MLRMRGRTTIKKSKNIKKKDVVVKQINNAQNFKEDKKEHMG